VLINKWDLVKSETKQKEYIKEIRENLKELRELPILCISGKIGFGCNQIFEIARKLDKVSKKRIPTSDLNNFFEDLIETHPPPDYRRKHVKLNYITQVDIDPPVFTIFTNQPRGIKGSYKKYISKGLRKLLGESIVPIVLKFRSKK